MSMKYMGSGNRFVWHQGFRNLQGRYALGYGTLIERDGSVVWSREWEHVFIHAYLFEDENVIITDRQANRGPWRFPMGIYCIDLTDGSYRWKHVSTNIKENNRALMNDEERAKSPKFQNPINSKSDGEHLITDDFLIDFETGEYEPKPENTSYEHLPAVDPLPEMEFNQSAFEDHELEFLRQHSTYGGSYEFSSIVKVWVTDTDLLVHAYPKAGEGNGVRLLSVDANQKEVKREWDLPLEGSIIGVASFLDRGLLIHQYADERYYLTIISTEIMP